MTAPRLFSARLATAALVCGLAIFSLSAFADSTSGKTRSVEVRYHDLDISTDKGAAELNKRVAFAIRRVCGSADIRNSIERQDMQRCRAEAKARTSRDIALAMENASEGNRLASLTVSK